MMELQALTAVSPVDGRYWKYTAVLSDYFSESALMKFRLMVEVEYLLALSEIGLPGMEKVKGFPPEKLKDVYRKFNTQDAFRIKECEAITNHDVKALEYFLKEKLDGLALRDIREFVHFGLTSQDINNTALPLSIKAALNDVYTPGLKGVIAALEKKASEWLDIAMLSRTHGQPASPTRLGKEIMVFVERLNSQYARLTSIPFSCKFGGATGNFNAHHVAYPEIDWKKFADNFTQERLGLVRQQFTTQIEHYDNLCAMFDAMKRINNILIDLNRDLWTYISLDYFKQQTKEHEIGSSAMPHKINPIDFENSEGNLGMANAILEHMSSKLPISRLQRDLTDSTVMRNVGVPFAHIHIALLSLLRGLDKLLVNVEAIRLDLENNWAVIAEAIQTILRRENYPNPYESLKELTRNHKRLTREDFHAFIDKLNVPEKVRSELKQISPFNYTGI